MKKNIILKENSNLLNIITINKMFSPDECKKIINLQDTYEESQAQIYEKEIPDDLVVNTSVRNSKVRIVKATQNNKWVAEKILKKVKEVNNEIFKFDISVLRGLQIIRYDEGCFFDWHNDIGSGDISTRKLSVIVILSDKKDYEGGELDFATSEPISTELGNMIIFPSFKPHKVNKVTRGVRYTLVGWMHGNAFI